MTTTWTAQKLHFLTQPELRALFRVITRKRDRALFLVAYRHGLRASEVGLLQMDDVNFAQQRLTIHRLKRSLPGILSATIAGNAIGLDASSANRSSSRSLKKW
jgi:integrase